MPANTKLSKPSSYVKAIIALLGSVLAVAASSTPLLGQFLPTGWSTAIGGGVALLTGVLTFLKANEPYLEDLGL